MKNKRRHLVTLGAGTGQKVLLEGLIPYIGELEITAVVSVSDNGGHSGELRKEFGIPQVGDSRQCLLALAPPSELRKAYEKRDESGRSSGNDALVKAIIRCGALSQAINYLATQLRCVGEILPATNTNVDIAAELIDGRHVVGEWEIIERQPRTPIDRLFLMPQAEAHPGAILAVQGADYVVVAPGSLRTGIVSCLLTKGMSQAMSQTQALVIYIVNLMTHPGQTDGFTMSDHVEEFARYSGRYPDFVVANSGQVPVQLIGHYASIGSQVVTGAIKIPKVRVIQGDFIPEANNFLARRERVGEFKKWTHILTHDGTKLADTIMAIVNGHLT